MTIIPCLCIQLQEKLAKIIKMGGLDAMTAENSMLNADVLDDDWDPVKHEVRVDYYLCESRRCDTNTMPFLFSFSVVY